jgi:heme a synthase
MMGAKEEGRLHCFAWICAVATWLLIGLGGLVTSHEAGLAVPDWPTTYGYNLFLFPFSRWVGGIFYEHTHRLLASAVGLLTVVLAVGLWRKKEHGALRWMGLAAVLLVVAQGVLGGLRVVLLQSQLGVLHALVAQLFLALMVTVVWWTRPSRASQRRLDSSQHLGFRGGEDPSAHHPQTSSSPALPGRRELAGATLGIAILILLQILLGAAMRHQHAGLSIPDFPLAYGRVWPSLNATAIGAINQARRLQGQPPVTAFQMLVHMAHRGLALLIVVGMAGLTLRAHSHTAYPPHVRRLFEGWCGAVIGQCLLGAEVIWSGKNPNVATLHVMLGALLLGLSVWLLLDGWSLSMGAGEPGPSQPTGLPSRSPA